MTIEEENLLSHLSIFDTETGTWKTHTPSEVYLKTREEAIKDLPLQKEMYKERGRRVVKPERADEWCALVERFLNGDNKDLIWSNIVSILATLKCMEKLSRGQSIEVIYKSIDKRVSPIYRGMKLSEIQAKNVIYMIERFHERGNEVIAYYNPYKEANRHMCRAKKISNIKGGIQ